MEEFNETEEENVLLVVLIALKAYEDETGKLFSVSKEVLNSIFQSAIKKDCTPVISIHHTDDNRLELGIELLENEKFTNRMVE